MSTTHNSNNGKQQLFDLDTSAYIYTATRLKKWNQVYRFSTILKQDVQPEILSQAIADLRGRFPTFYTQLKAGFFQYKLRTVQDVDILEREHEYPCRPIRVGSGEKPMFRVLYFKNRISVEVFHLVADGGGCIVYTKTLLARYFELLGFQIEKTHGVLDINENPKESETQDSFRKMFSTKEERLPRAEDAAYQYRPELKENYMRVIRGLMSVDELKLLTKAKGVTITQYFAAVYIYAFYQNMLPNKSEKPIKISIPSDLRRLFGSETLRNFSLFTNVGIHPKSRDYTFDEILSEIAPKIKEGLNKEALSPIASANVSDSNLLAFRMAPLLLKRLILWIGATLYGPRVITSAQSNLGILTVPAGMEDKVDHFEMMIGETGKNYINSAAITYNDILDITFTSKSEATDIQRYFFTFLTAQGIKVSIQSNV